MKIPVYAFLGFLESGKTTLIYEALGSDFNDGQKSLIIACEEGEEEYDLKVLSRFKAQLEVIESEEQFTVEYLRECVKKYHPDRIILEYNGMWPVAPLAQKLSDARVELYQTIMTIDGSTFQSYWTNMRSLLVEMIKVSELVIFNRCKKEMNINAFRRSAKASNPRIQVAFDMCDGSSPDAEEMMPYDLNAPVIEIEDEDYGIFHMDIMEHPERYEGKKIRFKAIVCLPEDFKQGFIPGRFAMTCCADDIQFIGYVAKVPLFSKLPKVKNRDWIYVTAVVKTEYLKEYRGKGPVYYPESIEPAVKPEQDVVYF